MRLSKLVKFVIGCGGLTTGCRVDTAQPETPPCAAIAGLALAPATPRVAVGDTLRMSVAHAEAGCGVTLDLSRVTLRWSVADSAIARVDSISGLVTGRVLGTTTVRATAGSVTGASTLSVESR